MLYLECFDDVVAMPNAARKDQHGVSLRCMLDDFATNGLDQRLAIHQGLDLVSYEFASTDMERTEIDLVFARF